MKSKRSCTVDSTFGSSLCAAARSASRLRLLAERGGRGGPAEQPDGLIRPGLEGRVEIVMRRGAVAGLQMGIAPGAEGAGKCGHQLEGRILVGDRLVEGSLVVVGEAATAIGIGLIGADSDRGAVILDRVVEIALVRIGGAPPAIGPGLIGRGEISLQQPGAGRDLLRQRRLLSPAAERLVVERCIPPAVSPVAVIAGRGAVGGRLPALLPASAAAAAAPAARPGGAVTCSRAIRASIFGSAARAAAMSWLAASISALAAWAAPRP